MPAPSRGSFLSIAMCTYNGEKFLARQLASILSQTRLPDEMVIRDDRSTDTTPEIIREFIKCVPFPVNFQVNQQNLGSTRNFEQAIAACQGDLITLCDQDDLWGRVRLERSENELLDHPEAGLVFSDGDVIDDHDRPLGFTLWQNFNFGQKSLEALQAEDYLPLAKRTFVTGATVTFRAKYAPLCFPTGRHWLHDGWLAMLISCMAPIRPISEKLISYRFHASQQVGLGQPPVPGKHFGWAPLETQAGMQSSTLAYLHACIDEICSAATRLPLTREQKAHGPVAAFERHRDFLAMRASLPAPRLRRLPIILDSLDQYSVSAMGLLSVAKDLTLPAIS